MTPERLIELHESVKWSNAHGNGQITLPANELLEVLPAPPVEENAAAPETAAAETSAPAGAPIVKMATLSQEEIDAQVKWDKEHPTQEEQERAAAAPALEEKPLDAV